MPDSTSHSGGFPIRHGVRLTATYVIALCLGLLVACQNSPPTAPVSVTHDIVYAPRKDGDLLADVYVPAGAGPFPAVITIHGGSWRTGWRWEMVPTADLLAARGMAVMNIEYRLVPKHRWPTQLEDVREALAWLHAHAAQYRIDTQRVGLWGYSAGAHLAMLLATQAPPAGVTPVQAVVAGGTPADLRAFPDSVLVRRFLGGTYATIPDVYREASPLLHVTHATPPTLLYHGTQDWLVDISQARALAAALRSNAVPVELLEVPGGHLSTFVHSPATAARAADFLQAQLGAGQR